MKLRVVHGSYGCECGCCGHTLELEGPDGKVRQVGNLQFEHANGEDLKVWARRFAKELMEFEGVDTEGVDFEDIDVSQAKDPC